MPPIRNIWEAYGFSRNPYHTDPLEAVAQDADLYVPRDAEEAELGTYLASEDSGAIFVEGHVGVGKTTFINQTQFRVQRRNDLPRILPSASLVEVQKETTAEGLALAIVTSVLKALRIHGGPGVAENDLYQEIEAYTKQAQVKSWTAGGGVAGFGANLGKTVTPTQPVDLTLQAFQDLLDDLSTVAANHGYDKVVVLLNNLDNVSEAHFFGLLHGLRDTLLGRAGWLFVMAGPLGLRTTLATDRAHRRISERVTREPVTLGPLSKAQVHRVIEARVDAYGLEDGVEAPVPRETIDLLYDASSGEIRYVLNRAEGVARLAARDLPTIGPIEPDAARAALSNQISDHIRQLELTDRRMEVLAKIAEQGEVQPKDYDRLGFNNTQSLSKYLREFHEMGLLDRAKEGREAIYTPRGDVSLFFSGGTVSG